jgi:hypothetical protein
MFFTISPFLVIDDNIIKASIKFVKVVKLNHLHLLGCLHHPMTARPPPKIMVFPFVSPPILLLLPHVDLIHSVFFPLWNIHLLLGKTPCFDPHLSPFGIKSPKRSLAKQYSSRED